MMRLRRHSKAKCGQPISQMKCKKAKTNCVRGLQLLDGLSRNELSATTLYHQCLQRMVPHVWHKIIPSSSHDVENMASACGESWALLQKLLLHLKYLYKYKDTFRMNVSKFKELENDETSSQYGGVHIGSY